MAWTQTTYKIAQLFAREDQKPTALVTSLGLPDRLLKGARAVFVYSLGGPNPIGHIKLAEVDGALAWSLDAVDRPFSLTIVTLPWRLEEVPVTSRLDCIDELMARLALLPALRAASMRELVRIAREQACAEDELAELEAYARAAGM